MHRRFVLTGLAGLGVTAALPALAQGVRRQSDPWAQVNPYDDPRNGFPAEGGGKPAPAPSRPDPFRAAHHLTPEEEEEIAIGRAVYPRWVAEAGGPYPDPRLQQALADFCKPIFAVADRHHLPWVVTLTDAPFPNVNASAGHGGHVIVHTAMIQIFERPEYLAAILGHEVGHVDLRHGVRGSELRTLLAELDSRGLSPVGSRMLGTLLPETRGRIDYAHLVDMAFSREDEADADAHSVKILDRMGVDPRFAVEAETVMLKVETMLGGGAPSEWVTDHPLTPDRVEHLHQLAALAPRPRGQVRFPGWEVLKAAFPTLPAFKQS